MLSRPALRGAVAVVAVVATLSPTILPALAQIRKGRAEKSPVVLPPSSPPATPAPPPESKPYDPQLMRLAEILGALNFLQNLCGDKGADRWRAQMQSLLDAEGVPAVRKDRLAGAYNQGLRGYELSYHSCTANAHVVIDRFLAEGHHLAQDIENRFRAS